VSGSAISPPADRDRLLPPLAAEDFGLEFRVVARGGTRRGIRLERAFWTSLKQMAEGNEHTVKVRTITPPRHFSDFRE